MRCGQVVVGDEFAGRHRPWWRSRRAPRRRARLRLPIISPSEEFLPPTWARSDRRRSCSQRTWALKAGAPRGQGEGEAARLSRAGTATRQARAIRAHAALRYDCRRCAMSEPAPGLLRLRRHRHHRRNHRPQPADPVQRHPISTPIRIPFVDTADKARGRRSEIRAAGRAQRLAADRGQYRASTSELERRAGGQRRADAGRVRAVHRSRWSRNWAPSAQPRVGQAHGMVDFAAYEPRINATNYALTHDDGIDLDYDEADLILVGVSRSGKTPTCLYLALHYGVQGGQLSADRGRPGGRPSCRSACARTGASCSA